MEQRRLSTDDDLRRISRVWLGPPGKTLPFAARYQAYGVFGVCLLLELMFRVSVLGQPFAISNLIKDGVPAWVITLVVMHFVDHERPIGSIPQMVLNTARAGRTRNPATRTKAVTGTLRIRHNPWRDTR